MKYSEMAKVAEVETAQRQPLMKGEYTAEVIGAEYGVSRVAQNPYYRIMFQVTAGEYKGRTAVKYMTLTAKSATRFFRQMDVLGIDTVFFAEIEDDPDAEAIVCRELIGAHAKIVCGDPEWYEGKSQTNIKSLKRAA